MNEFIKILLEEAKKAYNDNEVPIGSIIVKNNKIISKAHNLKETKNNVLCHAELLAINNACNKLKNWRLNDCILYTTLFPCPMCASAIQQSRIKKVIYLNNSNNNFAQNISNEILSNKNSNHQVLIEKLDLEDDLINAFFKKIRDN